MDEFCESVNGSIEAIKIDVEGHELEVLKGAIHVLQKHKPVVVCEAQQRRLSRGTVADLFEFMQSNGYDRKFIYKGSLISISEFVPHIHQAEIGERFWDSKSYSNNFIFTPV